MCGLVRKMENDGLGLDIVLLSVWISRYVEGKDLVEGFRDREKGMMVRIEEDDDGTSKVYYTN